jgi:hypothetical protein
VAKTIYKKHLVAIWDSIQESWEECVILNLHIEGNISFYLVRDSKGRVYSKQVAGCDEIRPAKPASVHAIKKPKLRLVK